MAQLLLSEKVWSKVLNSWHMNSLPSVLAIAIRGFHTLSFSRRRTMSPDEDDSDPFSSFFDPDLRSNLKQFVKTYFQLAKGSDSPLHALRGRHTVTFASVSKANSQCESFTLRVFDEDTRETHAFVIERTVSTRSIKDDDNFKYFTQCPDSEMVLKSIQLALQDMSAAASNIGSTSHQAFAQGWPSTSPSESPFPLLPLTIDHISPSNSIPTPQSILISWSLAKAVAAACSSAQSFPIQLEAEDTISVVRSQDLGKSIRQYEPDGLSLFDVVMLSHVVHKLAPTYALFESQCYWFANVIFEVIVSLFPSRSKSETPAPGSPPTLRLPNDSLPKEAGQWCGVLINDPHIVEAVVSIAKSQFESQQARYLDKVIFFTSELMLAKSPKFIAGFKLWDAKWVISEELQNSKLGIRFYESSFSFLWSIWTLC